MNNPEVFEYIRRARAINASDDAIRQELLKAGWDIAFINHCLIYSGIGLPGGMKKTFNSIVAICIILIVAGLFAAIAVLWDRSFEIRGLGGVASRELFKQLAAESVGFVDAKTLVQPQIEKEKDIREQYISEGKDFIEADLSEMLLYIYRSGKVVKTFPIMGKGKEGSFWETPIGNYSVLRKETNHYSSIGGVWMPWSIQFYGNFYIHGWPYYEGGAPVPKGYSGGCIRLTTQDAEEVYEFVDKTTPILIRDDYSNEDIKSSFQVNYEPAPLVQATAYAVADLSTGEILLGKSQYDARPVASLTKLMTGIVASELVYLERSILVRDEMLSAAFSAFQPKAGDKYLAFDLLYPLLMQSSNPAANLIAAFVGRSAFVKSMNQKALSLDMPDTKFEDPTGIGNGNVSSPDDLAKLLRYMYFKRRFLLDITKGVTLKTLSGNHGSNIKNFNEFVEDGRLVGIKNGETGAAGQTMASVWEFPCDKGLCPIAIIVLGSTDRSFDTSALVDWVEKSMEEN